MKRSFPSRPDRFLVDESTGQKVAEALRKEGFDVLSVIEDMRGADDIEIIQRVNEGRIIVTNDKDFGELIFRRRLASKGVLLLRLEDESPENKIQVVMNVLTKWRGKLLGNFIVATERSIRRRPIR